MEKSVLFVVIFTRHVYGIKVGIRQDRTKRCNAWQKRRSDIQGMTSTKIVVNVEHY
jgi:hypothetical protein